MQSFSPPGWEKFQVREYRVGLVCGVLESPNIQTIRHVAFSHINPCSDLPVAGPLCSSQGGTHWALSGKWGIQTGKSGRLPVIFKSRGPPEDPGHLACRWIYQTSWIEEAQLVQRIVGWKKADRWERPIQRIQPGCGHPRRGENGLEVPELLVGRREGTDGPVLAG